MSEQPAHPVSGRERPILFSGEMVRAILAGRKTQTRRVVKVCGTSEVRRVLGPGRDGRFDFVFPSEDGHLVDCLYGVPGDRLWVKETWGLHAHHDYTDWYAGSVKRWSEDDVQMGWKLALRADDDTEGAFWRPSIFMRRWMSRISLPITSIRVERLQDISEEDAKAEGVHQHFRFYEDDSGFAEGVTGYRRSFAELWDSINGAGSWDLNPWVWVVGWDKAEVR